MKLLMSKAGFNFIGSNYIAKSVDLDTISSRLSDDWLPYNIGGFGRLFNKIVTITKTGKIRFPINLFDTKTYLGRPL